MKNTSLLISFLQTWGIILVVLGHSFKYGGGNPIHTWIYSFHMPLFMFISGFLLRYGNERKNLALHNTKMYGVDGFIWKKTRRLLIPMVVISSIAYIPKVLLSSYAARPIDFSLESYLNMFIYPSTNAIQFFWFLPTLFLVFLIVIYCSKIFDKIGVQPSMCLIILMLLLLNLFNPARSVQLLNISGVVQYLLFFMLGYYSCQEKWHELVQSKPIVWFGITLFLSVLLLLGPSFKGRAILTAINGIIMSISFGYIYLAKDLHLLNHLFGASYTIYLFSWFPQVISQQLFIGITHAPYWIGSLLAFFSGLYIPLLIFRFIKNGKKTKFIKCMAFLSGM